MFHTLFHSRGRSAGRTSRFVLTRLGVAVALLFTTVAALSPATDAATRVRVSGGRLLINGDTSGETIKVIGLGSRSYRIEVDGQADVEVEGVTAMTIRSSRGNDRVHVIDATLTGDLVVDLGPNQNWLMVTNSEIGRNLTLTGGNDADTIILDRTIVEGRTNLRPKNGADDLIVSGGEFHAFSLSPGAAGAKEFIVEGSPLFWSTTSLRGGRARDLVLLGDARLRGATNVLLGSGDDVFRMNGRSEADRLRVDAGAGADRIVLDDPEVLGSSSLRGGAGNDLIELVNGRWQNLQIQGGSGDDDVALVDASVAGNLDIRLDAGDDVAQLTGDGRTQGTSRLNGGSGIDTLAPLSWRFQRAPTITAFELS